MYIYVYICISQRYDGKYCRQHPVINSHHSHESAIEQSFDDIGIRPPLLVHVADDGSQDLVAPLPAEIAHEELVLREGRHGRPILRRKHMIRQIDISCRRR